MTIIAIWSVFLGEVTFCEFLVCFPIIPFLRFLFGELTELVFLWRIELRGLKLWWSGTSVLIRFWRLWLCDLFWFPDLKDECFGFHQCLTASQTFSNPTVFFNARLSRKEDVGQDVYEDQKAAADFQVCGFDWACRGWNFGTPFCKAHGFGPACDKILVLQIAKFVVLTGPAADEILDPFCKAHGLCWACQWRNFCTADCQVCGLDWACRGWNFGAPFCKAHGLCWACQWPNFRTADCQVCGLDWACRGWNFGTPFCKAHGLCWACQWQNFRTADCQVCGLDWACCGWNFWAPFCKAHGLCWACQWPNFRTADCQVCGLDWACRGWNFGAPFCKAYGLCWACQWSKFSYCRLPSLWSWLGLPRMKFWNSIL